MIACGGEEGDLALFLIVFTARRRVRGHNGRERGQDRQTVEIVSATRMLNDGRSVNVRIRRASLVHTQARLGNPSSGVETGVIAYGAANLIAGIFARARFATNDRIARSVDRELERLTLEHKEERTMRAVARAGRFRGQRGSAVAVANGRVRAVVRIVKTRHAVRHTIDDVRRTTVVIVRAAQFYQRARVRIGRTQKRVDFRRSHGPSVGAARGRQPRLGRAATRIDRVFQRRLFDEGQKLVVDAKSTRFDPGTPSALRRQIIIDVDVIMDRKAELFHIVRALHTTRSFARSLNRRQKQADQNSNDRDNDQ